MLVMWSKGGRRQWWLLLLPAALLGCGRLLCIACHRGSRPLPYVATCTACLALPAGCCTVAHQHVHGGLLP